MLGLSIRVALTLFASRARSGLPKIPSSIDSVRLITLGSVVLLSCNPFDHGARYSTVPVLRLSSSLRTTHTSLPDNSLPMVLLVA